MEVDTEPPAAAAASLSSSPFSYPSSSSCSPASSSSSSSSSSSPSSPAVPTSAAAAAARGVRTPGERLGPSSAFASWGRGTYERDGCIYAAVVGQEHLDFPTGAARSAACAAPAAEAASVQPLPTVSVVPLRQPRAVLPVVGSIVLAQVTKVSLLRVECSILVVENHAVPEPFKGVVRAQDIRETDVDSVDVFESFHPLDILRARVISVADPRCYLLSTAAVHLGVLYAQGKEGGQLRPVTRRLMRCDLTGNLYRRKVAVPLPVQNKS